jgi:hypothetical protein
MDRPADVTIRFGKLDWAAWSKVRVFPAQQEYISFEGLGAFVVSHGRQVTIDASPGADDAALRQVLLGVVMSIVLRQRGCLVLHASGVRLRDGAVLFLGPSGAGKSTMAAAFAAQGHQVGTDDIAAVCRSNTHYELLPGFPRIRLNPVTAPALGHTEEGWPLAFCQIDKRSYGLNEEFFGESSPLLRIYLLAEGAAPQVERPVTPDLLQSLIEQSFIRPKRMNSAMRAEHVRRCLELAGRVPVRRLARSRKLADLPALVRLVEDDLQRKVERSG